MRVTPAFVGLPEPIVRTLLLRGVVLWILTRVFGKAMLSAAMKTPEGSIILPAWIIVMTVSLILIDLHRRHELALLHNLGVTTSRAVVVGALPALVGEALLVMLLA